MNNFAELKRDITGLQQNVNQHAGLINALLQQKGTQEAKLECMKQLNAAEFENVEAYMEGVKTLFGWLTGRDVELENTRNTLNAVNQQLAEAKARIETLEKDNKALVAMTEGLEAEATQLKQDLANAGKVYEKSSEMLREAGLEPPYIPVIVKGDPDADVAQPETEEAQPEGDHAGGPAHQEGAPEAPEQEGDVKNGGENPDPVQ